MCEKLRVTLQRTSFLSTLSLLLLTLLCGCTTPTASSSSSGPVGEIHLFGLPTALTLAGSSVAGGVGIRIYASELSVARGIPIREGKLEILMFDRSSPGLNPESEKPLKVWTFEPKNLAPYQSTTLMGIGYQLELVWGDARPKGKSFTVIARYYPPGKPVIYSTSATIAVTTH